MARECVFGILWLRVLESISGRPYLWQFTDPEMREIGRPPPPEILGMQSLIICLPPKPNLEKPSSGSCPCGGPAKIPKFRAWDEGLGAWTENLELKVSCLRLTCSGSSILDTMTCLVRSCPKEGATDALGSNGRHVLRPPGALASGPNWTDGTDRVRVSPKMDSLHFRSKF